MPNANMKRTSTFFSERLVYPAYCRKSFELEPLASVSAR